MGEILGVRVDDLSASELEARLRAFLAEPRGFVNVQADSMAEGMSEIRLPIA